MRSFVRIAALVIAIGATIAPTHGAAAQGLDENPFPAPAWTDTFGPVALSSPTVATIDGESVVVFGSENGYVDIVNAATGMSLPGWPEPVELTPGIPSPIESSPTVAYLNGPDGAPTIIVGAGSTYVKNSNGGLVAFRANGTVLFRFATKDVFDEWVKSKGPDGYNEAVFSTPTVGDITGSGQQDIVFGSWDHNLYALTPTGTLVPGFPIDTEDTIWSSPALFHVRGSKRQVDIFVGGDASGRLGCEGGFVYDVTYRNNAPRIVWQHCEEQTVWSSPAIGALNATGKPILVVGTGFGHPPPYKPGADRVYGYYTRSGVAAPGWPVDTAGPSFGSPAIGPLSPGGPPVVVDTSWCEGCTGLPAGESMVYMWSGTGKLLWSTRLEGENDFASPILADMTGSGINDVVVGSSAGLYALDGATGSFLFGTNETNAINTCSVQNAAAVANVPGTGWQLFETCGGPVEVNASGRLLDYPLPATPLSQPPWPMSHAAVNHDGVAPDDP